MAASLVHVALLALLSLTLAQSISGPCALRTHNCPLIGATCTDNSTTTFTCECEDGFTGPGTTCTTTEEFLLPTAEEMALTLGAFYENNLETLSADLENVTVISFEIQAVQSVDINNRNTTVYIASTVIDSTDIPTYQPLYNNLIVRRLSVLSMQVYTTSTPRGAQLQLDSEFFDPPYTPPSPTPPAYIPPPPPAPEPTPVPAPSPPPPLPPGQVIEATKCPFDSNLTECSFNGDCNTTTFTCDCYEGFDGPNCEDSAGDPGCPIEVSSTCSERARCINIQADPMSPPQYVCRCWSVFVGNGIICEDLDECLTFPCWRDGPYRAACTNVPGSYWCNCPPGFEGDGYTECVDINECEQDPSPCDPNADCANLKGSYACTCKSGYTGNGTTCTPLFPTRPPQVQIPTDTMTWSGIKQKINPHVLCWSRGPTSWKAFLAYENENLVTQLVSASSEENRVTINNFKFNSGYSGQTTYFGPGFGYAFEALSTVIDSTSSITWRVDGNIVTIARTSGDAKYRCPERTKLEVEITIDCTTEDLESAALALRDQLINMMEDVRAARGYPESTLTSLSLDVGILDCEGMDGVATFNITDPVGPDDGVDGSMFDLIFPILSSRNLSTVARDVPAHPTLAPRPNGYSGIARDEPIASKAGKSALHTPETDCDIEALGCLSWLIFSVIIVVIFIVIVLIIAVTVFLVKRHRRKKNTPY